MKRICLLMAALTLLFGDEMKVCESEQDKISGCVEKEYHDNGNLWIETPYRSGKKMVWREGIIQMECFGENIFL